ncbi:MAG: hypothetical protein R3230_00395 [Nitrosopumilaceae archaeon]|nr:hypothetical protein [Nitrosopumilaceae archaeon]
MSKKPPFPEFDEVSFQKNVDTTYTSGNTETTRCFCTGACLVGPCPYMKESPEQKARRIGVKVIVDKPKPEPSNPPIAVCGRCSRTIYANNNIACPDMDCPCNLGPMLC